MKKIVLLAVTAISLTACGNGGDFDTWVDDCYHMGGVPQITASDWYECFVDGKQVLVPGWDNKDGS